MAGEGAFYKPHMDSAGRDPRRLTAIVYLVPPDWDACPNKDGGQLKWWIVPEDAPLPGEPVSSKPKGGVEEDYAEQYGRSDERKRTLDPKAGRLVLFKARTVMHEVLPTHRKRFALTLWYFDGTGREA